MVTTTTLPRVSLEGVTKRFDATVVLDAVDLTIRPGEVHGLIGENGSGKSTLIKILAGYHDADAGELAVDGQALSLTESVDGLRSPSMAFVHQDLGLLPSLSVVDNFLLPHRSDGPWRLDNRRERREVHEALARYGVHLDVTQAMDRLRPVERAQVAIVRAIESVLNQSDGGGLLVLDEPTVFLPRDEVEHLFALVDRVTERGASVLFVSHDIEEVETITDRLTVLRDGRKVATVDTASLDNGDLVELIIGRRLDTDGHDPRAEHRSGSATRAPVQCAVAGLDGGSLEELSFVVHEGEILGLAGLIGSGFDEIPYLLFGASPVTAGRFMLDGEDLDLVHLTPEEAMRRQLALIPADRKGRGSVGNLTVEDNLSLTALDDFVQWGVLNRAGIRRRSQELVDEYDVRPRSTRKQFGTLSGGNQQKVVLGKWLQRRPKLLLLHEPTQGVDAGAREQVYELIQGLAETGASVLCASTDSAELAALCDRVLVFRQGRVSAELTGGDLTKERISHACLDNDSARRSPMEDDHA